MIIRKVKFDGITMTVHYDATDTDHYQYTSDEQPHPAFHDALRAMGKEFCNVMNLEEIWLDQYCTIQSVTIKDVKDQEGDLITKIQIGAIYMNDSGEVSSINTPLYEPSKSGLLQTLVEEAKQYIKGRRAQLSLFDVTEPIRELKEMGVTITLSDDSELERMKATSSQAKKRVEKEKKEMV